MTADAKAEASSEAGTRTLPIGDQGGGYVAELDSLRTFAVLGVILGHTTTLPTWFEPGGRGVEFFFVLSGFLISRILFGIVGLPNTNSLTSFYARRALRILPLFYVVLVVSSLARWSELADSWVWHAVYLSNFWIAAIDEWPPIMSHFWSLAVEEQFYLVWPVVLVLTPRRNWRFAILALLVIGPFGRLVNDLVGMSAIQNRVMPYSSADLFGSGALAAYWLSHLNPSRSLVRRVGRIAFALGIGAVTLVSLPGTFGALGPLYWPLRTFTMALPSVGLILMAVAGLGPRVGRLLRMKVLVLLGRISYGMYAWHLLGVIASRSIAVRLGYSEGGQMWGWRLFLATTAITVLISTLSWFLFEGPLNRLKSRFPYSPDLQPNQG